MPTPPATLRLRFSEPLDLSATRVVVTDEGGERVDAGELALGPPGDRLAVVGLVPLGEGVYTVRWATLSQVDGHRWQGTFRFGVGRAPPAVVDVAPPLPSSAELAIRWLALVATTLLVGGLTFRAYALEPILAAHPCPPAVRRSLAFQRAALGLLALASIGEFVASLGVFSSGATGVDARFGIGKAGSLALLRVALVPMIGYLASPRGSLGMALAFTGMLVLTRAQAAHAALFGLGPIFVEAAHQAVAAVWLGGAAALACVVPVLAAASPELGSRVAARFARLAGVAAGLALASGLGNVALLGLAPDQLFDSRYGQTLALKLLLVLAMLGLAALVWRRVSAWDRGRLVVAGSWQPPDPGPDHRSERWRYLRLELVVGAGVLASAAALALLPAPSSAGATVLELIRPINPAGPIRAHLRLDGPRVGTVRAEVHLADRAGALVAIATDIGARLRATPLDVDGHPMDIAATVADGRLLGSPAFDRAGWWRVAASADFAGQTFEVPFELLVPDPNRGSVDLPVPEAEAERMFAAALARMERLRAIRQHEALSDGVGGLFISTAEYAAPDRARLTTDEGDASVTVGMAQMFRRAGQQAWQPLRRTAPLRYPNYRATYEGATAQRAGRTEELDGIAVRILSFYVPRDRAWYCWWVADDGLVHREAMVAPSHYMSTRLDRFDAPADITLEVATSAGG